jgi:hypothetical protein
MEAGDGDERHGTLNGYINVRCRCELCREANRVYNAERRKARIGGEPISDWGARRGHTGEPREHNSSTYINWGCRCVECREDASRKRRNRGSHVCDAPFPVQVDALWKCPKCRVTYVGGEVVHPKLGKAMGWTSL